jgi:CO/xanthine dehydrogenase FAD-binding subunit
MEVTDKDLVIGALTKHRALEISPLIKKKFTALFEGCSQVGSVQIRCRGTVGGNICNAVPSADSIGPLLVFGSSCVVSGLAGERTVPLCDFFKGPKRTVLGEDEILKSVIVPLPEERSGSAYTKYTRRNAMDLALFGVSCYLALDEEDRIKNIRIALTTAAPTPMRAFEAEKKLIGRLPDGALAGEAGELVASEARPRSSWRSSAEFRIKLAKELTGRTMLFAAQRAKESIK